MKTPTPTTMRIVIVARGRGSVCLLMMLLDGLNWRKANELEPSLKYIKSVDLVKEGTFNKRS